MVITMTKERLQIEAIRLAEKANRMVKEGELSKFQAGFFLRQAVKELIEISQKKDGDWNVAEKDSSFDAPGKTSATKATARWEWI